VTKKLMTLLGLALGPVAIVLVDVLFTRSSADGVFEAVQEVVRSTGVTAFPVGVLIGHWYYPGRRRPVLPGPWNYVVLAVSWLVVGLGTLPLAGVEVASNFVSTLCFLAGLVAGVLLWSMDR
jgi:hypothetical protein